MRLLLTFIIFIQKLSASPSCSHDRSNLKCAKYLRNYDGDTITFNISSLHPLIGKGISIRVRGIDTPEIKTKKPCEKILALRAKDFVQRSLSTAKVIHLRNVERGKYFRIVADVIFDGKSLSQELIKSNMAISYDGGTKKIKDWCSKK